MTGIGVQESTALVRDNTVYDNDRSGIGIRGGQATIENNEIYQNQMAGIGMDKAQKTVIIGNRIHHNGVSSVWTWIKNLFSFTKTSLRSGVGVGIKKSEVLVFSSNTINNSAVPGLAVLEGSSIEKGEKNLIEKNGSDWAPNIALLDQSRVTLSETTIREGDTANIYLSNSYLTLKNCLVEKAWRPGIVAEDGSVLKIDGGSISNNGAIGVLLEGSRGNIQGAVISGNEHHGIGAEEKSSVRVEGCTITNNADHGGAGVSVDLSKAYLIRNLIHHNDLAGVEADGGELVLWNNVLADQVQGAEIEGRTLIDIQNNIFANNRSEGLELDKSAQIKHLSHNVFWNNGDPDEFRPIFLNFIPLPPKEIKEGEEKIVIRGNFEENPGFIDPTAGDYRLQAGSALIDAGKDVGLPFKGKAPDIGAIEH
jgi:hypothetical protein